MCRGIPTTPYLSSSRGQDFTLLLLLLLLLNGLAGLLARM